VIVDYSQRADDFALITGAITLAFSTYPVNMACERICRSLRPALLISYGGSSHHICLLRILMSIQPSRW
jgi:hypothetical protein